MIYYASALEMGWAPKPNSYYIRIHTHTHIYIPMYIYIPILCFNIKIQGVVVGFHIIRIYYLQVRSANLQMLLYSITKRH